VLKVADLSITMILARIFAH